MIGRGQGAGSIVAGKTLQVRSRKVVGALAPPEAHSGHEPVQRVERLEKVGPTHAKELQHLVGIGMSIRQGEPCSAMRLDFELSCGTARLRVFEQDLEITLRLCHVSLERVNCEVEPHSHYEYRLSDGTFQSDRTETQTSERSRVFGGALEAGLGANPVGPTFGGKMKAFFRGARQSKEQRQETVRHQPRVDLIVTAGQDRWQVGDALSGDARRADGRLLGSYFGEGRDDEGDARPLCILARTEATRVVEITVAATVPVGHLSVAIADSSLRDEVVTVARRASAKAKKEHATNRAELRSRVAGMVAGKALEEAQRQVGLAVPDGECIVALQTLVVLPASELFGRGKGQ